MVKNLNQLKKVMQPDVRFEITTHFKSGHDGQIRRITQANTVSIYSCVDGQPEHTVSTANGGRGTVLWWEKASQWSFENGLCSFYRKNKEHTKDNLVMSFRILEEAA